MTGVEIPTTQQAPHTRESLAAELTALGVRAGDVLLTHSSLSALGWVCGGAVAVVQALRDALGDAGTLVVPTQTGDNTDPRHWANPPVPESWWPAVRAHTPAFDPATTPSRRMGQIAEAVRTWPGAVRSNHPQTSFAAVGPAAGELMADHDLACRLGERSPLAALERRRARVLLLGAGFESCTAFHLAEYRVPTPDVVSYGAAVDTATGRAWVTFEDVRSESDDFTLLGASYVSARPTIVGRVGQATCRLFPLADAVAFAVGWLPGHRR
jgi:aminoglycoside 3-N-acetyltransferase